MGTYYLYVCESRKEYIDPGAIADEVNTRGHGIKAGPVILMHSPNIVACFGIFGDWSGESYRIVGDYDDTYEIAEEEFCDVTRKALALFKTEFEEQSEIWKLAFHVDEEVEP